MTEQAEQANQDTTRVVLEKPEGNGLAVTALVLGIVGVALNFIPFLPYLLGILAIIFGYLGMSKPVKKGMAKAGLILGIITIGLKVMFWLGIGLLGSTGL
ncbi:DUF4190 domain-containing protein [Salsuginibacillus kocurii]|uniref:DUF4190 domain-containing protein n=1 Tax=Salsuginibacillus kocurii TaxID=427078 RepID=UPI000379FE30|nr:DUF4190 domain-containing protein [Salsuginibacillus kocurii]